MSNDSFVTAAAYVRAARLRVSGRTLQRWCDDNPFLAERLGEIRTPRRRLFDSLTAPDFRAHWIAAGEELRRAEDAADRFLRDDDDEQDG